MCWHPEFQASSSDVQSLLRFWASKVGRGSPWGDQCTLGLNMNPPKKESGSGQSPSAHYQVNLSPHLVRAEGNRGL